MWIHCGEKDESGVLGTIWNPVFLVFQWKHVRNGYREETCMLFCTKESVILGP